MKLMLQMETYFILQTKKESQLSPTMIFLCFELVLWYGPSEDQ